jgi:hypothetical protein
VRDAVLAVTVSDEDRCSVVHARGKLDLAGVMSSCGRVSKQIARRWARADEIQFVTVRASRNSHLLAVYGGGRIGASAFVRCADLSCVRSAGRIATAHYPTLRHATRHSKK